jgi:hypothetical protein
MCPILPVEQNRCKTFSRPGRQTRSTPGPGWDCSNVQSALYIESCNQGSRAYARKPLLLPQAAGGTSKPEKLVIAQVIEIHCHHSRNETRLTPQNTRLTVVRLSKRGRDGDPLNRFAATVHPHSGELSVGAVYFPAEHGDGTTALRELSVGLAC